MVTKSSLPIIVAATRTAGSAGTHTKRNNQPGCTCNFAAQNHTAAGSTRKMAAAAGIHSSQEAKGGASSDANERARSNTREAWSDVASMIASTLTATQSQMNHQAGSNSQSAATTAATNARAGSSGPMPPHQAAAANSQRGAPAVVSSAAPASWISEVRASIMGPADRTRLLTIWRENFLAELKCAKEGVSLADIAWARAHQSDVPRASDYTKVLKRLDAGLRSRTFDDELLSDCVMYLNKAPVLSRASQLAWFLGLESEVVRPAVPSPYPVCSMESMWARLRLSPIDGSSQHTVTQVAYREFTPIGTPFRYYDIPISDALPMVFSSTSELLAFEAKVATDSDKILADRSHMCHELWHIWLFHSFMHQLTGVDWASNYLVLSHQLPDSVRLHARRCVGGRPRRPVVVRARGRWFVHHIALTNRDGVWIADMERPGTLWSTQDVSHAISTWIRALRDYFVWSLETGVLTEEFLSPFVPPP